MDFLIKYGLTQHQIDNIIDNIPEATLFDLECNEEDICSVIDYLLSIGVNNNAIYNILCCKYEFLLIDIAKIKEIFSKYNLPLLVRLINEDIAILDNL